MKISDLFFFFFLAVVLIPCGVAQTVKPCGVAIGPCPADKAPQYFPTGSLGKTIRGSDFVARNFRHYLVAMGEPSLLEAKPESHIYRVTEGYEYPRTFRLEIAQDGTAQLTVKELASSSEDLVLSRQQTVPIESSAAAQLVQLLESPEIWTPAKERPGVLKQDGRQFIVEDREKDSYKVTTLDSPRNTSFEKLYQTLTKLTDSRPRW